ncbi:terminase small subunit [Rhizorhabdus histidinilytica]|uniref:terminase small subunit n=1 Tax=Rhizorhabdus histidinilytica TaxID=439228 RepID=UPI00322068C8
MTPKQRAFVLEYLVDLNATQAAIRAGYSAKTADQQGSRLLANVKVAEAISAAQLARSEKTKIDADWVLARLAAETSADVADLYDETGRVKPIHDWPLIWRQGLVAGIETTQQEVGRDKNGNPIFATAYKLKLSDRARRVEMLGKHVFVSAFREQVDHTSSDGSMSPPSLADFYAGKMPPKADGD